MIGIGGAVWAGNGRICLRAPEPGAPLPEAPAMVVEVRAEGEHDNG